MKLPSFQFYPGDWRKDPNLRRCSAAGRGVWMDMLCLMFDCEDRGVLSTGGEPWSDEDIAAAVGGDISENLASINELLRKGVARRNQAGAIFSKRMVRDEQERRAAAERKRLERLRESHGDVTQPSRNGHKPSSTSPSSSGKNTHTRAREDLPSQEAITVFEEVYEAKPDLYSRERMEAEVKRFDVWGEVLRQCRANKIPATKVGTMLNIYHDRVKGSRPTKTVDPTLGAR